MSSPTSWRIENVELRRDWAKTDAKLAKRPALRRLWGAIRWPGYVVVMIGQPLAGMLGLALTINFCGAFLICLPLKPLFWFGVVLLFAIYLLLIMGMLFELRERFAQRIIDPHLMLLTTGTLLGLPVGVAGVGVMMGNLGWTW
jgi:hypothetical protein